MPQDTTPPELERLFLPLWPDVGRMCGLKRAATYQAAHRGTIPTVQFGKRRKMVPITWVQRQRGDFDRDISTQAPKQVPILPQEPEVNLMADLDCRRRAYDQARAHIDQLLLLPPHLLGESERRDLQHRLDRNDRVPADLVRIQEHLDRLGELIRRLL